MLRHPSCLFIRVHLQGLGFLVLAALLSLGCGGEGYPSGSGALPPHQTPQPLQIISFTPSATQVQPGKGVWLYAMFTGGTGTIEPGGLSVASGNKVNVQPSATTTYTLNVTDGRQTVSQSLQVLVGDLLPVLSLVLEDPANGGIAIMDDVLNGPVPVGPSGNLLFRDMRVAGVIHTPVIDRPRRQIYLARDSQLVAGTNYPCALLVWDALDLGVAPFSDAIISPRRELVLPDVREVHDYLVDSLHDRIYAAVQIGGREQLWVLTSASTQNGPVAASVVLDLSAPGRCLALDTVQDRLFVAVSGGWVHTYDTATQLASSTIPTRSIGLQGLEVQALAVDGARDRLYLASSTPGLDGAHVYGFADTASLSGAAVDPTLRSTMCLFPSASCLRVDDQDRLYATVSTVYSAEVWILYASSTRSGVLTSTDRKIFTGIDLMDSNLAPLVRMDWFGQ